MIRKWLLFIAMWLCFTGALQAQNVALKTNFVYWATLTPNLGLEASVGRKHTVQLFYGWNPWEPSNGKSFKHWSLQPEYRYWFCEAMNGWFLGVHAMGGEFNVANLDIPFGLWDEVKDHRFEGWFAGGGISAGYQWPLSKHWNLEASLGVGYDYIRMKKFRCGECGEYLQKKNKHYFGPTKAAISLMYVF